MSQNLIISTIIQAIPTKGSEGVIHHPQPYGAWHEPSSSCVPAMSSGLYLLLRPGSVQSSEQNNEADTVKASICAAVQVWWIQRSGQM